MRTCWTELRREGYSSCALLHLLFFLFLRIPLHLAYQYNNTWMRKKRIRISENNRKPLTTKWSGPLKTEPRAVHKCRGRLSFKHQIFDAGIDLMKGDSNPRDTRRAGSEAALVSSYTAVNLCCSLQALLNMLMKLACSDVFALLVGESGADLGRWWSEWCIRFAWYSSGELTSAMMHSNIQRTSLGVHPCIMNGCIDSKNKTEAAAIAFAPPLAV